jgi:hypothetical protein
LAAGSDSVTDAEPQPETGAPAADVAATAPQDGQEGLPSAQAPEVAEPAPTAPETVPAAPAPDAAPATRPAPRAGTKQAQMIAMLKRPEGATVEQIAEATGWQPHTIRGAISGALKKKLGLTIEATRTREVGPNIPAPRAARRSTDSSRRPDAAAQGRTTPPRPRAPAAISLITHGAGSVGRFRVIE